jgi:hypothetical protein
LSVARLPGSAIELFVVRFDPADAPAGRPARRHLLVVSAASERAGLTVPAPLCERDRPTEAVARRRGGGAFCSTASSVAHVVEAATDTSRRRQPASGALDLELREVDVSSSTSAALVSDHAVAHVEQVEDLHVLFGLRHQPSFAATTSARDVDRPGAGGMFFTKHVAGNVDEADDLSGWGVQSTKPRSIVSPRSFSSGNRPGRFR